MPSGAGGGPRFSGHIGPADATVSEPGGVLAVVTGRSATALGWGVEISAGLGVRGIGELEVEPFIPAHARLDSAGRRRET
ncbi:MAG: hypothetical protein ACRDPT_05775 [Streptomycetales bacterium]